MLEPDLAAQQPALDQPVVQPLTLRMQNRIGFGAFSTVFLNPENGRVYKVFKERDENNNSVTWAIKNRCCAGRRSTPRSLPTR